MGDGRRARFLEHGRGLPELRPPAIEADLEA
jgi:hypothetical protein